jgi:hypothetical protein
MRICMELEPMPVMAGEIITTEGELGSEMYILQAGAVLVSCEGRELGILGDGSFFGEVRGPPGICLTCKFLQSRFLITYVPERS